jgi:hypothetical protein
MLNYKRSRRDQRLVDKMRWANKTPPLENDVFLFIIVMGRGMGWGRTYEYNSPKQVER